MPTAGGVCLSSGDLRLESQSGRPDPPSARLGVWNGSLQPPRQGVGRSAGDRGCPVFPVPFLCSTRRLPVLPLWLWGVARALPVRRGHAQRRPGPAACGSGCQRVPFPGEGRLPAGLTPRPPQPGDPAEPGAEPPAVRRRGCGSPVPGAPGGGWIGLVLFRVGSFLPTRGALCLSPALFVCDGCLSCARTSGSQWGTADERQGDLKRR